MIPTNDIVAPTVSEKFQDVAFDIDEKGRAYIFKILRDSLYSNKPMAVLKEYSINGLDAHVEAGKSDLPIEVTLPNVLEPVLKIRDFGKGLSHEDIVNVYCKFGASTKRNSNEVCGMMGIGGKCAFSYGDNFVIVSRNGGTKTTYNAYLDETQIGRIATLASGPCDEPTGVEIQVPIKTKDIELFAQIAANLFSYFKVPPIIKGRANFKINRYDNPILSGTDWSFVANGMQAIATMGEIGYPIDATALRADGPDSWMRTYIQKGFIINFPIGVLEVSSSREGLQYTDRTIKAIKAKLAVIKTEIEATLGKEVLSAKTLHEAKMIFKKLYGYGSPLHALNIMAGAVSFNGKTVGDNNFQIPYSNSGFSFTSWSRSGGSKAYGYSERSLLCDELSPFFIDDNTDGKIINRVGALLESDTNALGVKMNRVYVLKITDQAAFDLWAKNSGFDAPLTKLSSLPLLKISQIYPNLAASTAVKNVKHTLSVFTLNTARPTSGSYVLSNHYTAATVDLEKDSGLYILIDRFYPEVPSAYLGTALRDTGRSPDELREKLSEIYGLLGLPIPVVYCVKEKQKATLGPNFKCLFSEMADKIKEYIVAKKIAQKAVDRKAFCSFQKGYILQVSKHLAGASKFVSGIAAKYAQMENANDSKVIDRALSLQAQFNINLGTVATPTFDLGAENEAFNLRYKMLYLGGDRMVDWSSSPVLARDVISEYVIEQDVKHEFLLDQNTKQK